MLKQVRETAAGKSIAAYIITKGRRHVATVHAHFSDGGMCSVDIFDNHVLTYQGRANGYGYDKFTAAISGAVIDGHKITDHCGTSQKLPRGLDHFPRDFKPRKGYTLANWRKGSDGWSSCFKKAGLDYLRGHGYTVTQAI